MSQDTFTISACPTCHGKRIQRVGGTWRGNYQGKTYEVPHLEYYSCPDCGEKVYPPQAMRKIEESSPAYSKSSGRLRARVAPNSAA